MVPKHLAKTSKTNRANGNKHKNPLIIDNKEQSDEDKSILRQPMDIGIRGVKDLIKALAGGTSELQDLLLNECTVIYECKICCNLFRSLANFISHKRLYCVKSFCYFSENFNKYQNERPSPPLFNCDDVMVIPDMPSQNEQCLNNKNAWVTSDKIYNEPPDFVDGFCNTSPSIKFEPVKISKKRDIAEIIDGLNRKGGKEIVNTSEDVPGSLFYSDIAERVMMRRNARQKTIVELENINDSGSSVFQTLKRQDYENSNDSMKIQVEDDVHRFVSFSAVAIVSGEMTGMTNQRNERRYGELIELDRVVSKNQAILQENGKFMVTSQNTETEEERNLEKYNCSFCDSSFLTQQTLSRHIQIYHRERICYPCPLCRIYFASPSSVYRHLSKAHHRTEQQIRRLRPQVFSKARKRKLLQTSPKVIPNNLEDSKNSKRETEDWINNFEGVLRCNGCGKLFNRRAVLSVHSATCKKKLAFNNSTPQPTNKIKSNSRTVRPPVKEILALKNSKPLLTACQLPKTGILVRKDYCKTSTTIKKPLTSSLLADNDKDCSWDVGSCKSIDKMESYISNEVNAKCHNSGKLNSSLKSNSVLINNSTTKTTVKKSSTLNRVISTKKKVKQTKKNYQMTPLQMQDISVKN